MPRGEVSKKITQWFPKNKRKVMSRPKTAKQCKALRAVLYCSTRSPEDLRRFSYLFVMRRKATRYLPRAAKNIEVWWCLV